MPKPKRKFKTSSPPPIDWLYAAYLERRKTYGYDLKQMAIILGIEYGNMRRLDGRSPWMWKRELRDRMCDHFGISINVTPTLNDHVEVKIT